MVFNCRCLRVMLWQMGFSAEGMEECLNLIDDGSRGRRAASTARGRWCTLKSGPLQSRPVQSAPKLADAEAAAPIVFGDDRRDLAAQSNGQMKTRCEKAQDRLPVRHPGQNLKHALQALA